MAKNSNSAWSKLDIVMLKRLTKQGKSAGQIGRKLGRTLKAIEARRFRIKNGSPPSSPPSPVIGDFYLVRAIPSKKFADIAELNAHIEIHGTEGMMPVRRLVTKTMIVEN